MNMANERTLVHVNDVDLNVVTVGRGVPALVFLHYWGGSSRTWAPVMECLASSHRCVAIDFRGWGESSKESSDYGLATLANDVIAVIEKLGVEEFFLLGHSMGGKVAQLVAARHPAGLRGLILFAPAPPTPMNVPEEQRRGYVGLYESRQGAEIVIRNLTPHTLPDSVRERIIEDTLRGSPGAKRAWPLEGMITDISAEARKIAVPVHIIAGGDDRVEPEASLRAAFGQVLRNVDFVVVPGVGHIAPLEAPSKLAEAIRAATATCGFIVASDNHGRPCGE
jgi:pimeloyl-ACP methyl ester carboxylesterase